MIHPPRSPTSGNTSPAARVGRRSHRALTTAARPEGSRPHVAAVAGAKSAGYCAPVRRHLFKSKIHRANVTHADLHYEGSVTIDQDLLEAADILPYEKVAVWNVTRGSRLETYALEGERGSGVICLNGAAAHLNEPGDLVIIATFAEVEDEEAKAWTPTVVFVDAHNRIVRKAPEVPGPKLRAS